MAEKEKQEAGVGAGAEEEEEIREEERQVGRVRLADYKYFIKVLGPWLCLGTGGKSLTCSFDILLNVQCSCTMWQKV